MHQFPPGQYCGAAPLAVIDVTASAKKTICQFVLSDKHWLMENLLCLLSNAIKYSDDNTKVRVVVDLVPTYTLFPPDSAAISAAYASLTANNLNTHNSAFGAPSASQEADLNASCLSLPDSQPSNDDGDGVAFSRRSSLDVGEHIPLAYLSRSNTQLSSEMIRITVEDTGIGLSDEAKKRLFRPFKQAQRFTGRYTSRYHGYDGTFCIELYFCLQIW